MESQNLNVEEMILHTFSADYNLRKLAEEAAESLQLIPDTYATLLEIGTNSDTNVSIRQAATVTLKNFIKKRWHPLQEESAVFTEEVKIELRELILKGLIYEENNQIRKILIAIVGSLAGADSASKWPNLLSNLIELLSTTDSVVVMHNSLLVIRTIAKQDGERVIDTAPHFFKFVDVVLPLINTLVNNLIEAENFTDEVSSLILSSFLFLFFLLYLCYSFCVFSRTFLFLYPSF